MVNRDVYRVAASVERDRTTRRFRQAGTRAIASGAIALLLPACFYPNYDRTACGSHDECPPGLACSLLRICEAMCSSAAKFGTPVPVPELATTALIEGAPRLSTDELTLYFSGHVQSNIDWNLYATHRSSLTDAFEAPRLLAADNSNSLDGSPAISADGLALWFQSDRVPNEGTHLYVASRSSTLAEFGTPGLAAVVNAADVKVSDFTPFMTADGKELWFVSTRSPGLGGADIWRVSLTGTGGEVPVAESQLSSSADDWFPSLSADQLTIYLASNRSDAGTKGGFDIWSSHRSTITDRFPRPTLVDELNTTGNDYATWLTADNCRIYISSERSQSQDIFMATRQP